MDAYEITLILHNLVRWLVVIAGVLAAGRALYGWLAKQEWTAFDNQIGLLYTVSFDIQVLLGLILYFVLSPKTTQNFSNFGEAMSNSGLRFYLVEHILTMLVALGLAHAGRALSRRAELAVNKHKRAAIFFTLSLLAVLAMIPWDSSPLLRL